MAKKETDDEKLSKLIKAGKPIRLERFILSKVTHITGDIKRCVFTTPKGTTFGHGVEECIITTFEQ